MEINLSEKLKSLRKSKNVSQEKLAQYLNVSFQAVSKWENGLPHSMAYCGRQLLSFSRYQPCHPSSL